MSGQVALSGVSIASAGLRLRKSKPLTMRGDVGVEALILACMMECDAAGFHPSIGQKDSLKQWPFLCLIYSMYR